MDCGFCFPAQLLVLSCEYSWAETAGGALTVKTVLVSVWSITLAQLPGLCSSLNLCLSLKFEKAVW